MRKTAESLLFLLRPGVGYISGVSGSLSTLPAVIAGDAVVVSSENNRSFTGGDAASAAAACTAGRCVSFVPAVDSSPEQDVATATAAAAESQGTRVRPSGRLVMPPL